MIDKLDTKRIEMLNQSIPAWAVKPHPTKKGMSTIHPMAVIDRLNEVFGVGGWSYTVEHISCEKVVQKTYNGSRDVFVSAVKGSLKIGDLVLEQFGGSTNDDKGDALKGGATDALTKTASYLGVGAAIYKGQGNQENEIDEVVTASAPTPVNTTQKASKLDVARIRMLMTELGKKLEDEEKLMMHFSVGHLEDLNPKQAYEAIVELTRQKETRKFGDDPIMSSIDNL